MKTFFIESTSLEQSTLLRDRLSRVPLVEAADAASADVVCVLVLPEDSLYWTGRSVELLASTERSLVLFLSSACTEEDWDRLLAVYPSLVSMESSDAEFFSRLAHGTAALLRHTLSRKAEGRLSLLRESLEEVSMIDMRTGMYNRRFLLTRLHEALSAARRYARPLSLIVFRISDYDALVSRHGDDAILQRVDCLVDRLSGMLRSADVQAWIRADEFALLLPETGPEGAAMVVSRVQQIAGESNCEAGFSLELFAHTLSPSAEDRVAEAFLERAREGLG